jgi:hypothetical protein
MTRHDPSDHRIDRSAGDRPVQRDLESGYVSIEAARKQHGVIVDPGTSKADAVATRARQAKPAIAVKAVMTAANISAPAWVTRKLK